MYYSFSSNPLLLNKLSLNNISDRLALAASQNYNSTELESMKEKNDQNSTNHSDAYSPVALNLTNKGSILSNVTFKILENWPYVWPQSFQLIPQIYFRVINGRTKLTIILISFTVSFIHGNSTWEINSNIRSIQIIDLVSTDMSSSAYTKTKIVELENDKEISEGNEKPMERDQQPVNGTSAESPQNNNVLEMFDNNDTSANIEEGAGNAGVEDDMTNSEDSKQSPFPNVQVRLKCDCVIIHTWFQIYTSVRTVQLESNHEESHIRGRFNIKWIKSSWYKFGQT